ncbi:MULTISPECIES: hypothetical protein [unclassified Pseudomonas]|uniref:hypothetical protein n=1 Tax=unclassified Pseudomonas TaxID=196821 RepID=UPI002447F4D1|nr:MULTISPECIES: hypothetical protein [unclassified Pseudomonas]MDH0303231.1 hypothetical protein [Pseudomonas sp. GD04091]MDH1987501.1 hypothetical protein [Pseudomonas sp. GD03689]
MTALFRLSLLLLVIGMLLGDIVLASLGLIGLCGGAIYLDIRQDSQAPGAGESEFTA